MALRIRRGTDEARTTKVFESGELVYTTQSKQLWVGDGITQGGTPVVGSNVAGYGLSFNGITNRLEVSGLTSDDVTQGLNNKYFSTELAVDAVGAALVAGNSTNIGITFTYAQTQDDAGRINATVALDGVGITDVVNDTSPSLGGDLDLNTNAITGVGDINITGDITITGTAFGDTVEGNTLSTGTLLLTTDTVGISSGTIHIKNSNQNLLEINGVNANGSINTTPNTSLYSSRGTLSAPTNSQPGDYVGVLNFGGYYNGNYQGISSIISRYDDVADFTDSAPGSILGFITNNNNGDINIASFNMNGVFDTPTLSVGDGNATNPSIVFSTDGGVDTGFFHPGDGIVCISTNAVERVRVDSGGMRVEGFMKVKNVAGTLPSPAEAGMIVLDGGTFKGYNGSAWVDLG